MIIVHINTLHDTDVMSCIYDNLSNAGHIVMVNPIREDVELVLSSHPTTPALFLGHGSPMGIFTSYGGFLIDGENVDLLRDREVIGIWCYARRFAEKYNLKGFFTSMFVSNSHEAAWYGFGSQYKYNVKNPTSYTQVYEDVVVDANGQLCLFGEFMRDTDSCKYDGGQANIDEQNILFCQQINDFIRCELPIEDWIDNLQYDESLDYVRFNYTNMAYFGDYE